MRALVLLIFFSAFCLGANWRVVHVSDADTIKIVQNKRKLTIRFWGIDAPESDQRYGKFCTKLLAKKILHKSVSIQIKATDKYKRKVAKVFLGDEDINKYVVDKGCAWAYTYYTKAYLPNQKRAQREHLGLWQDVKPIEPYIWRKMHPKHHQHKMRKHSGYFQQAVAEISDYLKKKYNKTWEYM